MGKKFEKIKDKLIDMFLFLKNKRIVGIKTNSPNLRL